MAPTLQSVAAGCSTRLMIRSLKPLGGDERRTAPRDLVREPYPRLPEDRRAEAERLNSSFAYATPEAFAADIKNNGLIRTPPSLTITLGL
jgi:hypothetical protein